MQTGTGNTKERGPFLGHPLSSLVENCEEEWGKPEENQKGLAPFPSETLSDVLRGIDMVSGETIGIIGEEKHRKTTLAMNILYTIYSGVQPVEKPRSVIFTLESGQDPSRIRDIFISMKATHLLAERKHGRRPNNSLDLMRWVDQCVADEELCFSPGFLRFVPRTGPQMEAIRDAIEIVSSWDIFVVGPARKDGSSRDLEKALKIVDQHGDQGARVFLFDHLQQFSISGVSSAYEKLDTVVDRLSAATANYQAVSIMLSQVSLTSLRESRNATGEIMAAGGKRLHEESNVVFLTEYSRATPNQLKIDIVRSRRSGLVSVRQEIDVESGLFLGRGRTRGD